MPVPLDEAGIEGVIHSFEAGARRALTAGFKVIELHAAHGYLLHEFLSPLSNRRDDQYGGNLENRMRLLLRVVQGVRGRMPEEFPLFVRISATDWAENGWDLQQSIELARRLKGLGVDLIDVSSGGTVPYARIPVAKGYQVPLSRSIREGADIRTGAVGLITEARYADEIVTGGDANLVFIDAGDAEGTLLGFESAAGTGCGSSMADAVRVRPEEEGQIKRAENSGGELQLSHWKKRSGGVPDERG